ncbi:Uncharacterised protein [Mycobacteroides abscessus subsp. abscessus]|nr:Uncharacterised protein [Mycobacteroides abscessus subsp. abscessus]
MPNAESPPLTCAHERSPTDSAAGYLAVNHPTVRDRSISAASSSARPWPSRSMPMGAPPAPRNSFQASAKAMSKTSCIPAWNAAGTSPSSIRVTSASRAADNVPATA